jgi:hypothetical protein
MTKKETQELKKQAVQDTLKLAATLTHTDLKLEQFNNLVTQIYEFYNGTNKKLG